MSIPFQSLSSIFEKRLFRIPDYQRGYAWEERHLRDFWEDLYNLRSGSIHYTGALSLQRMDASSVRPSDKWLIDKEHYRPFYVIDGQQRLTTAFVLLHEIVEFVASLPKNEGKSREQIKLNRDNLRNIENKYLRCQCQSGLDEFSYLLDYDDKKGESVLSEYMRYGVFGEKDRSVIIHDSYTQRLGEVKQFFHKKLEELYKERGEETIGVIYNKLTNNFTFSLLEFDNNYNAFVTFETMNDRGKPLSNLELLKNRLIYLSTLFDDKILDEDNKDQLRREINEAWREIYHQLGRNQRKLLDDDKFLHDHSVLYFYGGADKRKLLNIFSSRCIICKLNYSDADDEYIDLEADGILRPKDILQYVHSLRDIASFWYITFFPEESDLSSKEEEWLRKLNQIGFDSFRPLATAILTQRKNIGVERSVELYQVLERFIFVQFGIMGHRKNFKQSHFAWRARDIYRGKFCDSSHFPEIGEVPIDVIKNELMEWSTDNIGDIVDILKAKSVQDGGWYGWGNYINYFLFEYECYLANGCSGGEKITWRHFSPWETDRITIEHILPQTLTPYWEKQFGGLSAAAIERLSQSLGNLLLLSQSINSSLQNSSFSQKKRENRQLGMDKRERRGYSLGSYQELDVAKNENWTATDIKKRGIKLLEFMNKNWKLEMSRGDIEKALSLNEIC